MSRMTAVRRVQFCAGHRVHLHESKCANPHGHNYVAFFHVEAPELDKLGRVIDFSCVKERLGGWVDEHWDHGFIYYAADEQMAACLAPMGGKVYELQTNPTAENMALHLLHEVGPLVLEGTGVRLVRVVLWETENCYVDVSL